MSKVVTFKTDDSMERLLGLLENLDKVWDLHIDNLPPTTAQQVNSMQLAAQERARFEQLKRGLK